MYRDFKANNLGVRVYKGYCIVIEKKPGVSGWQECGQPFPLPLLEGFDSLTTIPLSRLVLAASAYEMKNPGNELRALLTKKPAVRKGVMAQDDQEKRIKKWLDVMELPSGLEEDQDGEWE